MNLLEYLQRSGVPAEERVLRGLIMRGDVLVNEKPQTSASFEVPSGANIRIRGQVSRPVSRGYDKLRPVLLHCGFEVRDAICADLGASTGGFTQCLLEQGAGKVYAIDVGYGLLAAEIRNNPAVVVRERTNVRLLTSKDVPELLERVVGDLSFISWRAVVPTVRNFLAEGAELLLLIKPQFELEARGRMDPASHGIVKRHEDLQWCLEDLLDLWVSSSLTPLSIQPAPIRGVQGNQEFFVHLRSGGGAIDEASYPSMVQEALAGVDG